MTKKDFDSFETLFRALQDEAGKDLLHTNHRFKSDFVRLKELLENVYKISAVPKESFDLANQLLQQIDANKKKYNNYLKTIDKRCDALYSDCPFDLFSHLKEMARKDRKAVETILNELTD